jgi:hypothetical protein
MTYQCPKCGGDELDIQVKVWTRFPEREVEAEDAWEAECGKQRGRVTRLLG